MTMTPQKAQELEQALRAAVEDAIVGEPMRAGLGNRARSAAAAVLHRYGVRGAKVEVRQEGAGFAVAVALPQGPTQVRQIVLRFGAG